MDCAFLGTPFPSAPASPARVPRQEPHIPQPALPGESSAETHSRKALHPVRQPEESRPGAGPSYSQMMDAAPLQEQGSTGRAGDVSQ